jgi:predicted helicase
MYRPYTQRLLYAERIFSEDVYQFPEILPTPVQEKENRIICTVTEQQIPFSAQMTNRIACQHYVGRQTQCFPLFTYAGASKERHDNITPKALTLFQMFYDDNGITREDIFHYVYALLHHPTYRSRYAENLKRELPRIPFVGVGSAVPCAPPSRKVAVDGAQGTARPTFFPVSAVQTMQGDAKPGHDPKASARLFHTFAAAGKQLVDLHVNYESAKEFPLVRQENPDARLDWRVEAMKLSKDKTSLFYNDFLTLNGIPPEVYDYRLGNRSALEWVIDQYRVTRDEKGNIASDPNRPDDEKYILRLIGQVITVSLETLKVVRSLPPVGKQDSEAPDGRGCCRSTRNEWGRKRAQGAQRLNGQGG